MKNVISQALGQFTYTDLMVKPVHACHLFCISFQFSFLFGTYSVDNATWPQ